MALLRYLNVPGTEHTTHGSTAFAPPPQLKVANAGLFAGEIVVTPDLLQHAHDHPIEYTITKGSANKNEQLCILPSTVSCLWTAS